MRSTFTSPGGRLRARMIASLFFGSASVSSTDCSLASTVRGAASTLLSCSWRSSAKSMSRGSVTGVAPNLRNWCPPLLFSLKMFPGTTRRSRLYSTANRAVMSVPDRSPASMTSVACDSPAIMRLRAGNDHGVAENVGSNSERRPPPDSRMRPASARFFRG